LFFPGVLRPSSAWAGSHKLTSCHVILSEVPRQRDVVEGPVVVFPRRAPSKLRLGGIAHTHLLPCHPERSPASAGRSRRTCGCFSPDDHKTLRTTDNPSVFADSAACRSSLRRFSPLVGRHFHTARNPSVSRRCPRADSLYLQVIEFLRRTSPPPASAGKRR
jgi:hypothetical protein